MLILTVTSIKILFFYMALMVQIKRPIKTVDSAN